MQCRIDFGSAVTMTAILATSVQSSTTTIKSTFHIHKNVICPRSAKIRKICLNRAASPKFDLSLPSVSTEVLQTYLDWIHALLYYGEADLTGMVEAQIDRNPGALCTCGQADYGTKWTTLSFLCMLWNLGVKLQDAGLMNEVMKNLLTQSAWDGRYALLGQDGGKLIGYILSEITSSSALFRWSVDVIMSELTETEIDRVFETNPPLAGAIAKRLLATRPEPRMPTNRDKEKYHTQEFAD